jgi:hypothetical protein
VHSCLTPRFVVSKLHCLRCINLRPGIVVVCAEEEGETKEDEVILCDGCNAEVHLRCLNLTTVGR